MITQAQFDALGPIGQEIVNADRDLARIAREPVVDFRAYQAIRQDRKMLSNAAAIVCSRDGGGRSGAGRT